MHDPPPQLSLKDALDLYESGKHRRYSLLFAVNGGAFAVATFMADVDRPTAVLGSLTLPQLAIGMVLFTTVMVVDIYAFGEKMRTTHVASVFHFLGKTVLIVLGALRCLGWLLVALPGGA